MKKMGTILLVLLLLAVAGVSGYKLFSTLLDYRKASDFYSDVTQSYVQLRPADETGAAGAGSGAASAETEPAEGDSQAAKATAGNTSGIDSTDAAEPSTNGTTSEQANDSIATEAAMTGSDEGNGTAQNTAGQSSPPAGGEVQSESMDGSATVPSGAPSDGSQGESEDGPKALSSNGATGEESSDDPEELDAAAIAEALLLRSTREQPPISVDFEALKEANPDVVGWIYCADTLINYPVLQGKNNDQYLHRMLDGRYSASGSIFMDALCAPDFTGENALLYGHHMRNGSMFAGLDKFKDQEYYDEHSVMWLLTPEQDYQIQLFAGFVTKPSEWTYYVTFGDDHTKLDYIQDALRRTTFTCDVAPVSEDRIATLSTCDYTFQNARYVVMGIMVPVIEAEETETAAETEETA